MNIWRRGLHDHSYNAKGIRNCFLMPLLACRTILIAVNLQSAAINLQTNIPNLAGTTGFEPAISTLTGSHPRPLDDVPR